MSNSSTSTIDRPIAISIIAILGVILSMSVFVFLLSSSVYMERIVSRSGEGYLYFKSGLSIITAVACLSAYMLKRWSMYLFSGSVIAYGIYSVLFATDQYYFSNYLIPVVGSVTTYIYRGKLQ